jgi:hypothetical protein
MAQLASQHVAALTAGTRTLVVDSNRFTSAANNAPANGNNNRKRGRQDSTGEKDGLVWRNKRVVFKLNGERLAPPTRASIGGGAAEFRDHLVWEGKKVFLQLGGVRVTYPP